MTSAPVSVSPFPRTVCRRGRRSKDKHGETRHRFRDDGGCLHVLGDHGQGSRLDRSTPGREDRGMTLTLDYIRIVIIANGVDPVMFLAFHHQVLQDPIKERIENEMAIKRRREQLIEEAKQKGMLP
ncbi:hypothetical protein CK203_050621 [Vitis vinifera]|uniref:Uncharacterized protein n=1 Tax=Vitis vinifera TaxID=29760 RepID=A0A438GK98_VITVI|nr:hypothetical protein CK203_050621 [Vitis vinifera]